MFFGTLIGSTNYLAAESFVQHKETVLKMMSFAPQVWTSKAYYNTEYDGTTFGTIYTSQTFAYPKERKRDFFDLYEIKENWGTLYVLQRIAQISLPYLYLAMGEAASLLAFGLMGWLYYELNA